MTTARRRRTGYTLLEVLTVMAVLVVLGGMLAPTWRSLGGDSNVKAGADTVRGRLADARAAAIEQGRPYRVSVSADGTRVRVAPDDLAFAGQADPLAGQTEDAPRVIEEELPKGLTVVLVADEAAAPPIEQDGWVRVVTYLPDGTCREDRAQVEVREPGCHPMVIRVRGLTGSVSVTAGPLVGAGGGTP
jgi:prepilin-type N-terminal cleavage/methylation domain-containing protein